MAVLILLVALIVIFAVANANFFTSANLKSLITGVAVLWFVSIGMTFVILSGGFDLSVGAMAALAGIMLGKLYVTAGIPAGLAVAAVIAAGGVIGGCVNGVLIGRAGLSFLVVTLGTLALYQGVLNLWASGATTPVYSDLLTNLAFGDLGGVPYSVILMVVILGAAKYLLERTYFGRDVYAVGGNPVAASVAGVRVGRTLVIVYALAGALAALGGVVEVGRIGAASPLVGASLLFDASAAVLLGGTRFSGGVGSVAGTALGVLFLGVLQNGLSVVGVQPFWQQVITGAILIVVIGVDKIQSTTPLRAATARSSSRGARAGHGESDAAL